MSEQDDGGTDTPAPGDRANSRAVARTCAALEWVLAATGLWLAATAPVSFAGGTYDDLLYIRLATAIAHGDWLGPFDQLTLARGPVFPLFLAACALCRVPLNLAAQAVYLCGCLLLARAAGRALRHRPAATVVFALLALNPVPWSAALSLVLREKLYVGETMLVLGLAVQCLPRSDVRAGMAALGWAFASGLAFGAFWLTREEGIWMAPVLAAVLALRVAQGGWRRHWRRRRRPGRDWLVREAAMGLALPLGFLLVLVPFAAVNDAVYGVFRTSDFQTGPFPDAYGAMLRVRPAQWRQYGILPRDVRLLLYRESGAARELQPSLEGPIGQEWTTIGCAHSPIPDCHELQGGWAMFAVRNAVTAAGHYRRAADADAFYRRLAHEVNDACDHARLSCSARRSGMLPPFRADYVELGARSALSVVWRTAWLQEARPGIFPTSPSLFDLAESTPLVLGPKAPTLPKLNAPSLLAMGWVDLPSGDPADALAVSAASGQDSTLTTAAGTGIPAAIGHPGSRAARFQARCSPDCRLRVSQGGAVLFDQPASSLRKGPVALPAGAVIDIDAVQTIPAGPGLPDVPMQVGRVVGGLVRLVGRAVTPLAMLATPILLLVGLHRRRLPPVGSLAAVLWLALFARMAVVTVGDATTVPALEFRFLAPGMSIGLALGGTLLAALLVELVRYAASATRPRNGRSGIRSSVAKASAVTPDAARKV